MRVGNHLGPAGTEIRVTGVPAPQGSKRHVGRGRMIESSKKVGPWRTAVAEACKAVEVPTADYYLAHIVFRIPRPKSHYGTGRNATRVKPSAPSFPRFPDIDKLVRSTLDGLTAGGAWADDSQAVMLLAGKRYTRPNEAPGATIRLVPYDPEN